MSKALKQLKYDCDQCPSFCCSYETIPVTKKDIKRLALFLDIGVHWKGIKRAYTKKGESGRILRHRKGPDPHYESVCQFLNTDRTCGVYEARPEVCRDHPYKKRCGYYEFLTHERFLQEDKEYIP